jgi:hypothetical protein
VKRYQLRTASGPLRSHLFRYHAEQWVQKCQEANVEPRGKEGEAALAQVTGHSVDHQAVAQVPFTQENFLDAIVKFIIATDQVFFSSF